MSTLGPDRIIPWEKLRNWDSDGVVKIRDDGSLEQYPPISIPSYVIKNCTEAKNRIAMNIKRDGKIIQWTYGQYLDDVRLTAKAFIKLGLEPFKSVCIFGFNSPEWFFSCLGAIFAGGLSCGLYPTNSTEMNKFIMNDSQCNIFVCDDEEAVEKMWEMTKDVHSLKKIIQYNGTPKRPGVIGWKELMEIANSVPDEELDQKLLGISINQCATLIYTSGTTGNPKGVMLSHDNLTFTARAACDATHWRKQKEVFISYLPLSHVAGMLGDIYSVIGTQSEIYFADKNVFKGTLLDTLQWAKPTIFIAVPRVWEKIREGMLQKGKAVKGLKRKIADSCKKAGLDHHLHQKDTLAYKVGKKLIYSKVREALGLDHCVGFFSAAAPLTMETAHYFLSLDIKINEIYGMSETTGPHTLQYEANSKLGSVGIAFAGNQSKLLKSSNPYDKEGELCMWGRNVMMGYLNREDKTLEDLDENGWIMSGDKATIDDEGYVSITGRIKELIITAGGENVPPVVMEDLVKAELPCISNAILIGDKRKFISTFLTFKTEMNLDTMEPLKELAPPTKDWCEKYGRNYETVDDILSGPDPVLMAAIQQGINRANQNAPSNAARIQRWTILPLDISLPGGELGPTMKLKRFAFYKKYSNSINRLYECV